MDIILVDETRNRKLKIASRVLLIIGAVIYLAVTAFLFILAVDIMTTPPVPEGQIDASGLAIAVYLVLAIIGIAVYVVSFILNIISRVLAKKAGLRRRWVICPTLLAIISLVTSAISVLGPIIFPK